MKKSIGLLLAVILILTFAACQTNPPVGAQTTNPPVGNTDPPSENISTDIPPVSPVPQELKSILTSEVFDLLGKSRREIRPQYKMETSERDFAFWYSGLGSAEDGTQGNVFISYNIDGMSYDGVCDFISGEIERISIFEQGTTFEQFERVIGGFAQIVESGQIYKVGNYVIFTDAKGDNPLVIERLTIKDQPE